MQRYFIDQSLNLKDIIQFSSDDAHHIKTVMRMAADDVVEVVDSNRRLFDAKLIALEDAVMAEIITLQHVNVELPVDVTLYIPLLKGDKLDWLLQKATELGAHNFKIYKAERAVVKLDEKKRLKRRERFLKIVKEASEQSKRLFIPTVEFVDIHIDIAKSNYDAVYFAYEDVSDNSNLKVSLLLDKNHKEIAAIFGPEGGFSETESQLFSKFQTVQLGRRILRAETAPLYFMSTVSMVYE